MRALLIGGLLLLSGCGAQPCLTAKVAYSGPVRGVAIMTLRGEDGSLRGVWTQTASGASGSFFEGQRTCGGFGGAERLTALAWIHPQTEVPAACDSISAGAGCAPDETDPRGSSSTLVSDSRDSQLVFAI